MSWEILKTVSIPDFYTPEHVYLKRWILFRCRLFGVQIHKIVLVDNDRHLHDHPRNFWTFVLKGGYTEQHSNAVLSERRWKRWSFHRMMIHEYHRIAELYSHPTWTLVFVGRKQGGWGYMTEDGWIDHNTYWELYGKVDHKYD